MHKFVYKFCKSRGKYFLYSTVFLTKGRLIYILHLLKCPFLPLMTSQSDVNDTLTLRHLFCFWRDLVRFNFRKDFSPLRKLSLLSSSNITKNSIKIATCICLYPLNNRDLI